jgi:cell division protease FtsH
MWLPTEDKHTSRKNELIDRLVVGMGGRVAEELVFGDVTNGARGDIKQATQLSRKMVCEWGMSEKLGMVEYGDNDDYVFLGREISRSRDYSEDTAQKIDAEVKDLCTQAYDRAKALITQHRDKLDSIAKALLEFETLDGSHVREIIEHGKMITPPTIKPPFTPSDPPAAPADPAPEETRSNELPPGLAGAPAGA